MEKKLEVLNMVSGFNLLAVGLFAPLYAAFIENIGGSPFIVGTSYSIYAIAAGLLIFMSSRLENEVDSMDWILLSGNVLFTIAFAGYLLVEDPAQMFMVQAVLGVATAIKSPAFDDMYSSSIPEGQYAAKWGFWESMYWILTGISALIGGAVVSRYGFDTLFMTMTVFSALSVVVSLQLVRMN